MAAWKMYEWEQKTYPQFRVIKLTKPQFQKYIKKLSKHFKMPEPTVEYKLGHKNNGTYYGYKNHIVINPFHGNQLGTLCHEFAHHLNYHRNDYERGHGKKFKHELKRVYTWAKRYLPKPVEQEGTVLRQALVTVMEAAHQESVK